MPYRKEGRRLTAAIRRLLPFRPWIQAGFAAVWLTPLHAFSVCSPVFHCHGCPLAAFACPIGIMAGSGALHVFPFVAVGTVVGFGAVLGTVTCAWACPFGFLQDLAAKVRSRPFRLPPWTGYARYGVLAISALAVPYFFGADHPLFICRVCPAAGLEVSVPRFFRTLAAEGPAVWPDAVKLTILLVFLGSIFFFRRPWCRVLCPLGAIYSLFNRFSLVRLRLDKERCAHCGLCRKNCPADLRPDERPNDARCIRCFDCVRCRLDALDVKAAEGELHKPRTTP